MCADCEDLSGHCSQCHRDIRGIRFPLGQKTCESKVDPGVRDKLNCLHGSDFYFKKNFFWSFFFLLQVKFLPEIETRPTNSLFCLILVFGSPHRHFFFFFLSFLKTVLNCRGTPCSKQPTEAVKWGSVALRCTRCVFIEKKKNRKKRKGKERKKPRWRERGRSGGEGGAHATT